MKLIGRELYFPFIHSSSLDGRSSHALSVIFLVDLLVRRALGSGSEVIIASDNHSHTCGASISEKPQKHGAATCEGLD